MCDLHIKTGFWWAALWHVGVCRDWHTSLSLFRVAPAADKNPTHYHGDDQHHQAHGDQDDGET